MALWRYDKATKEYVEDTRFARAETALHGLNEHPITIAVTWALMLMGWGYIVWIIGHALAMGVK